MFFETNIVHFWLGCCNVVVWEGYLDVRIDIFEECIWIGNGASVDGRDKSDSIVHLNTCV